MSDDEASLSIAVSRTLQLRDTSSSNDSELLWFDKVLPVSDSDASVDFDGVALSNDDGVADGGGSGSRSYPENSASNPRFSSSVP